MPLISVVIPAHNRAEYLGDTIESVRAQTCNDWELIVVDDGSTDGTRQVVERYRGDGRVFYCYQTRQERSAARNKGIAETSGEFIALVDADDLWKPQKLARQLETLTRAPEVALCYTLTGRVDSQGRILDTGRYARAYEGYVLNRLIRHDFIGISSVLMRRSCLAETGVFDSTLPIYGREDWDLWLRIAQRYPVLPVREELTQHRAHEGNTPHEQNFLSGLAVLERRCADPQFLAKAGMSRNAAFAYHYLFGAGVPEPGMRREVRVRRLAWALSHYPPSVFCHTGVIALARAILPEGFVRFARSGYRRWLMTESG